MPSDHQGEGFGIARQVVGEKTPVVRLAVVDHFSRTSETSARY